MPIDAAALRDLMSGSRNRWTTMRARGREWRDHELLTEAFMRDVPPDAAVISAGVAGGDPPPAEEVWALWLSLPDDMRFEFEVGGETVTAVFRGSTWWSVSSFSGPITNEGDEHSRHGTGPGYPLTDPVRLARALDLEVQGESSLAGRPSIEAIAIRGRDGGQDRMGEWRAEDAAFELGRGADDYALTVDAEFGVVLRSEARLRGLPFRVIEMREVGFDEPLSDETFTLELPQGTRFKRPESIWDRVKHR
jgi:hypothetical protein